MKSLTIFLLLFSLSLSAQTNTVFHVGYGSGLIGGVYFLNPISKDASMLYGLQYVERNNRQFIQNTLGASFGNSTMSFSTGVFVGKEINQKEYNLNHVGLSVSLRCNMVKGIGLETKYEQSKTSNFYFQITYNLK